MGSCLSIGRDTEDSSDGTRMAGSKERDVATREWQLAKKLSRD